MWTAVPILNIRCQTHTLFLFTTLTCKSQLASNSSRLPVQIWKLDHQPKTPFVVCYKSNWQYLTGGLYLTWFLTAYFSASSTTCVVNHRYPNFSLWVCLIDLMSAMLPLLSALFCTKRCILLLSSLNCSLSRKSGTVWAVQRHFFIDLNSFVVDRLYTHRWLTTISFQLEYIILKCNRN